MRKKRENEDGCDTEKVLLEKAREDAWSIAVMTWNRAMFAPGER